MISALKELFSNEEGTFTDFSALKLHCGLMGHKHDVMCRYYIAKNNKEYTSKQQNGPSIILPKDVLTARYFREFSFMSVHIRPSKTHRDTNTCTLQFLCNSSAKSAGCRTDKVECIL